MTALAGLRVLDLTRYIPGPYCTMLLGDLGADVVKVEEPGIGDPTRAVPPAVGDHSAVHASLNRNKRSIVVDLRQTEGVAVVRRLAAQADVLVEAYRPGTLARRGLAPGELRRDNPRLVHCSLTGYGRDGPLASRAGHDLNYLALGGLLGELRADGRPVVPGAQIADMTGALVATVGILAALQARERSGEGQEVDVSLLESVLALMTVPAARELAEAGAPNPLRGTHACYNVYRCRDGKYLAVGALEAKFWESLCEAMGLPEHKGRQWEGGAHGPETLDAFTRAFASRDRDEWLRALATADACVEPLLEIEDMAAHEQVQARRAVVEGRTGGTAFRTVASPLRLSATPVPETRPVPALGQHTDEVLVELGYEPEEIARLRNQGVVQ
jgi:crotonobetainyl-CoA:carnitine CoA-transferase CaiB-like acyl-CoA transferase